MTMQQATQELFADRYGSIKSSQQCKITNIFDMVNCNAQLKKKECILDEQDNSLFLLIPFHDMYYNLLFLSHDIKTIKTDLEKMLKNYHSNLSIRASLFGKEELIEDQRQVFLELGFVCSKKYQRAIKIFDNNLFVVVNDQKAQADLSIVSNLLTAYYEIYRKYISFAEPSDAEEILEMMKSVFLVIEDNLPEVDSIREYCRDKKIVIIRIDSKIVAMKYVELSGKTATGVIDATLSEYKGKGCQDALSSYIMAYWKSAGIHARRWITWRDCSNKRLMKAAKLFGETPDGIVLYQMVYGG